MPGYFDELFHEAVYQWKRWRMFGLPHGRGWLAETDIVLQVIDTVEGERNFFESKSIEAERKRRENGNSRGTTGRNPRRS